MSEPHVQTGGLRVLTSPWGQDGHIDETIVSPFTVDRRESKRLRVLLVEDDPGDAQLVVFALTQHRAPGFQVTHVSSLTEALRELTALPPFDVVLLDLNLPDSSGLSTVSHLQEVAANVPIVIMTGFDDPEFADTALEIGAQDYLVKSDDPERTVARSIRYAITRMNARIERDALAQRVMEQQRTLLKELAAARAMQFELLPRPDRLDPILKDLSLDVEAAFEPSFGIGGDLWNCMECGPGRIMFYTFDFSGHGIGAALNVFRLHALISDRWKPEQSPAEFLSSLQEVLPGLLGRGQFATMFIGIIDTVKDQLEWAAAGAPAPIFINGDTVDLLDSRGIPLGLVRTAAYVEHRMAFPPGATLILYSDALTDSPDLDGEAFGESNLLGLVADQVRRNGQATVQLLLEQFYDHVKPPLPDDLTVVRVTRIEKDAR